MALSQKNKEKRRYATKLLRLFERLDESGDGFINRQELEFLLKDDSMKLLMSTLELELDDLEALFQLLDDGDDLISPQEFVQGLMSMKGTAKALDVVTLLSIVRRIEDKMDAQVDALRTSPKDAKSGSESALKKKDAQIGRTF